MDRIRLPSEPARRLAFTLKDVEREGELSLDVLFAKALQVLNRRGVRPGQAQDAAALAATPLCSANWLAKWALRAVCEAILAKGLLPLPLAVDLRWKGEESGEAGLPCVRLPLALLAYARQQGVNPRFLAEMVLARFMENPPAKLTFETGYPLNPGEVLPGDEWKVLPSDDDTPPSDQPERRF